MPWETGAALREVYTSPTTSKNEVESKETSEEPGDGIEGVHAQVLAPVMLAGGDPLCAALEALEGASGTYKYIYIFRYIYMCLSVGIKFTSTP